MTAAGRALVADKPDLRGDIVAVEVQAIADERDRLRKRVMALRSAPLGADDPYTGMRRLTKVVSLAEVMALIDDAG